MTAVVGRERFQTSPIFIGLVALTVITGVLLWRGAEIGGVGVFVFVLAGWTVSLVFHEFGHALVAYIGGDTSVASKGYLTMDPRRYVEPGLSIVMPLVILVIGGIGLPGGAVWINHGAIPSRTMRSLMSAAGPASNLICAFACLAPIRLGWLDNADSTFVAALGFLGAIQVIATVLNLIPIPGLDGFGILEPHLSADTLRSLRPLRQYGFMILIAALFFVPPVRDRFWDVTDAISEALGGDTVARWRSLGWSEFRFWQ